MTSRVNSALADDIAKIELRRARPIVDWDHLREVCDYHTDGELDTWRLDMLTDMVADRLELE